MKMTEKADYLIVMGNYESVFFIDEQFKDWVFHRNECVNRRELFYNRRAEKILRYMKQRKELLIVERIMMDKN